eukprot:CAMPEP_0176101098 /NCGR_PEP_ID=MMETSP0120_2-20121206/50710_1 /TAXON_ID=160619 /ORGANISM="Kryptoperidinium foliaceum, Strain CCMP 1326" /LENGTH=130 /DNA_ID=CAMNT_0017435153 /DNA_START=1 /DNA_END=394 /DNA_ORIENTATION=-
MANGGDRDRLLANFAPCLGKATGKGRVKPLVGASAYTAAAAGAAAATCPSSMCRHGAATSRAFPSTNDQQEEPDHRGHGGEGNGERAEPLELVGDRRKARRHEVRQPLRHFLLRPDLLGLRRHRDRKLAS